MDVISDTDKTELRGLCTDVLALATNARDYSKNANDLALELLEAITPAAQRWGMMVCLRSDTSRLYLIRPQENRWISQVQEQFEKLTVARGTTKASATFETSDTPYHCIRYPIPHEASSRGRSSLSAPWRCVAWISRQFMWGITRRAILLSTRGTSRGPCALRGTGTAESPSTHATSGYSTRAALPAPHTLRSWAPWQIRSRSG
jgi:hypothetical protein